jgi:hypothetical protein
MTKMLGAVALATGISVVAGLIIAATAILAGEPQATIDHALQTSAGFFELLVATAAGSLPITLPAGIGGGVLAAALLATQGERLSAVRWVVNGIVVGGAIGACAAAAWAVLVSLGGGTLLLLFVMAPLGALAGALVGGLVGAYCACASRRARSEGAARA